MSEDVATKTVTEEGAEVEATVSYNFGSTLDEAISIFGAEQVFNLYRRAARVAVQSFVSRLLKAGKTEAEIRSEVAGYKLEGRKPAKSKAVKAAELFAELSPEDQEKLRALIGGKKKAA